MEVFRNAKDQSLKSNARQVPHRRRGRVHVLQDAQRPRSRSARWRVELSDASDAVTPASPATDATSPPPTADAPRDERRKLSQSSSFSGSPRRSDGRSIYCTIAEDDGSTDGSTELCFSFKGTTVRELTEKLEEVLEIDEDIFVCTRNPLNGLLCPLHLQLPPNKMKMHVVVVRASSRGQLSATIILNYADNIYN
ncbi:uncharacterized protein A4U43_C03F15910 [Asparagus officinalis]|uniref:DUF569 domain-containing protein n=1 Tax=Asparagus officinalis TaxID=4686 RepID=A0A5P1FEN9_ASPOF|nr:uncharacterized protein A4U43_C03F15910 [Asparagus officinalis]